MLRSSDASIMQVIVGTNIRNINHLSKYYPLYFTFIKTFKDNQGHWRTLKDIDLLGMSYLCSVIRKTSYFMSLSSYSMSSVLPSFVILSEAKDLTSASKCIHVDVPEILRCALDDKY